MRIDDDYFCQNLGLLLRMPVRVLVDGSTQHAYAPVPFEPDPAGSVLGEILAGGRDIGFVESKESMLYGYIRSKEDGTLMVLGPTGRIRPGRDRAALVLRALGEPFHRLEALQAYFDGIATFSLESFLQILCFMDYTLNGVKRAFPDLLVSETASGIHLDLPPDAELPGEKPQEDLHDTIGMEQELTASIAAGNVAALEAMMAHPLVGHAGRMAKDELRQARNLFVCSATIVSRAAISGGLSHETAFTLSDLYIQKAEILSDAHSLSLLQMEMALDYARRVAAQRLGPSPTKLSSDVLRYVQANLHRPLSVSEIAEHLGMNRTYLGERFRSDTGIPLSTFIMERKLDEAKRLLRTTDLAAARISDALGFSSQGYFQNVFRKHAGCTPREFRLKL